MPMPAGIHAQIMQQGAIGPERWSIGYWLRYDSSVSLPTPTQANTYAGGLAVAWASGVWATWKASQSSDTTWDSTLVRMYDGSVLSVDGTATATPVPGTGSGAHPGYVALVVSLLTAFPGRSKRGRMYLPATAVAINGATSQLSVAATQDSLATNMAAYFASSAHTPSWGSPAAFTPVVMSKTLGSTADIISLRIDSIPDTQHGRTRKLVSVHTATHTVP